ncbi:MAG: snare associated Golgi protein-domain-containing protein [Monoraphidium minutum]|nr:MAG: snare associated Golgi protein-domain-containing protein [Monoraphidium minutum]
MAAAVSEPAAGQLPRLNVLDEDDLQTMDERGLLLPAALLRSSGGGAGSFGAPASAPAPAACPSRLLDSPAPATPARRVSRRSAPGPVFGEGGGFGGGGSPRGGGRAPLPLSSPAGGPVSSGGHAPHPPPHHPPHHHHHGSGEGGGPGGAADIDMASIAGLGGLAPLRCRAAAFDCAAAGAAAVRALDASPRLPAPDARPLAAPRRVAALAALVLLSLAGLAFATPDNIHAVVLLLKAHPAAGILAYLLVFTLGVILMLPGMLFSVAAGAAFGFVLGAAVSFVATTTGMILAFFLGRYLLHDALGALLLRRVPNFAAIDRRVAAEGWKIVLLLRLSPLMPYNVLNYAMGATSIKLVPYAIPSAAVALVYSCLFAYLGSAADDLLGLLNGGAAAATGSLGAAWLAGGTVLAVGSAYGIAAVCHKLLSAGDAAAPGGGGAPAAAPSGAARAQYAAVQQADALEAPGGGGTGGGGGGGGGGTLGGRLRGFLFGVGAAGAAGGGGGAAGRVPPALQLADAPSQGWGGGGLGSGGSAARGGAFAVVSPKWGASQRRSSYSGGV